MVYTVRSRHGSLKILDDKDYIESQIAKLCVQLDNIPYKNDNISVFVNHLVSTVIPHTCQKFTELYMQI